MLNLLEKIEKFSYPKVELKNSEGNNFVTAVQDFELDVINTLDNGYINFYIGKIDISIIEKLITNKYNVITNLEDKKLEFSWLCNIKITIKELNEAPKKLFSFEFSSFAASFIFDISEAQLKELRKIVNGQIQDINMNQDTTPYEKLERINELCYKIISHLNNNYKIIIDEELVDMDFLRIRITEDNQYFMPSTYVKEIKRFKESPKIKALVDNFGNGEKLEINKSELLNTLEMKKTPLASWKGDFCLNARQQYAVNKFFSNDNIGNVFSVNGPPGTGKTSLLGDIIANIIYVKAKFMYINQDNIFTFEGLKILNERYGIVITANNNMPLDAIAEAFNEDNIQYAFLNGNSIVKSYGNSEGSKKTEADFLNHIDTLINKKTRAANDIYQNIIDVEKEIKLLYENIINHLNNIDNQNSFIGSFLMDPLNKDNQNFSFLDEIINCKRALLTELSLELIEALIKDKYHNIMQLYQVNNIRYGRPDYYMRHKLLLSIYPCLTTTLHSFVRKYEDFKEDSIGFVIIEEAGQATISSSIGAIARGKRILSIGDQLQIKPIFPIDESLIEQLLKNTNLDLDPSESAQSFLDQNNKYGEIISNTWVGAPLVLHRRCSMPMFEIANEMVYDNLMVNFSREDDTYGDSRFVEVAKSKEIIDKNYFVPEQLEKAIEIIGEKNYLLDEVFIVSPFKTVVDGVKREIEKKYPELIELIPNIGTVHTFQGREANTVFFLGGIHSNVEYDGALNWVNTTPNIFNVAITRARREFIFIGESAIWNKGNYSNRIISALKHYEKTKNTIIKKDNSMEIELKNSTEKLHITLNNKNIIEQIPKGLDLSHAILDNLNFSGLLFNQCSFTNASITNTNFSNCRFINCNFNNLDLSIANIENAIFTNCDVSIDNAMSHIEFVDEITRRQKIETKKENANIENREYAKLTKVPIVDIDEANVVSIDFSNIISVVKPSRRADIEEQDEIEEISSLLRKCASWFKENITNYEYEITTVSGKTYVMQANSDNFKHLTGLKTDTIKAKEFEERARKGTLLKKGASQGIKFDRNTIRKLANFTTMLNPKINDICYTVEKIGRSKDGSDTKEVEFVIKQSNNASIFILREKNYVYIPVSLRVEDYKYETESDNQIGNIKRVSNKTKEEEIVYQINNNDFE